MGPGKATLIIMKRQILFALLCSLLTLPSAAQVPTVPLVALPNSMDRMAQPRYDRGAVSGSVPVERLLLVLNRPADREAAFQQVLKDLHTLGSPSYHHWLTPEQIGDRFGPTDAEIETLRGWLAPSGLTVARTSKARRFLEFSGTASQVNAAFHTQIHEYLVDREVHRANATPLRVPQAVAALVSGVSGLSGSRPKPQIHTAGFASYEAASRKIVPQYNLPSDYSPLLFGVAPADFATQYDLAPLFTAGVTGTGKTIGIIDYSNIDLAQADAYRSNFGLPANPVQVVLDGGDPGTDSTEGETYLDVEVAAAAAPGATVNLYLSAGSPYQDALTLAALRAVEDNQADVLSISYGNGEAELGPAGNQFWNALWEQAAAQGQTVMVSAGDLGQVPDQYYLFEGTYVAPAVNGIASTPWNVAVGGTDFYYPDYASGAPSASTFWNSTDDPTTKGSLKAPLSEQVWNDPFGLNAIPDGIARGEIYAGGGGASSCVVFNTDSTCAGGYPKPAWQSGPGVPADAVRDLPDVSLFASNGANLSGYVICSFQGACTPDANGNFNVELVGGTSASAPAMAGIMALVNQKFGRQGQAGNTLYALAQQKPAAFHDITLGGNFDICIYTDTDCTLNVAGLGTEAGESTVYAATPGFDQASGLGSVDAAQLVNGWNALTFKSTSTALQLSPANITHGNNVTVTTSVTTAGPGTPTGAVALLTNSTLPSSAGQTAISLTAGTGSTTLNYLPGGTYQLTGRYGGDGVFESSSSQPETLTVSPEKSTLTLIVAGPQNTPVTSLTYGLPVNLSAQPVGINAPTGMVDGNATGDITFTVDGKTTAVPMNVGDIASLTAPALAVGSHTASASYAGDGSFLASSAAAQTFSVTKGQPWVDLNPSSGYYATLYTGASITVSAEVGTYYGPGFLGGSAPLGLLAPTGTVTVKLVNGNSDPFGAGCANDNTGYAQTATLVSPSGLYSQYASAQVVFSNIAAGYYNLCGEYSGDANWLMWGELVTNPINIYAPASPAPVASTTALTITPANISGSQIATLTATVAAPAGATVAPTGTVSFFDNGVSNSEFWLWQLLPSTTAATATFAYSLPTSSFWNNGANQITAVYSGDSNYLPSTSAIVPLTVAQGGAGFSLTPQSPQLTVSSGGSVSSVINLTSLYNFNGTVALTCSPSSSQFSCNLTPASVALNGSASATITIAATLPSSASGRAPGQSIWLPVGATLAVCLLFFVPSGRLRRNGSLWLLVLVTASAMTACGGSKNTGSTPPPPPANGTPAGTYTVVVTGTANGTVHNAKITLLVP